jgi:L-2-hydroxyglutarate oxidase LhgO
LKTDFIIIGIVGLSTAYHLKKHNPALKVIVLEKEIKIHASNRPTVVLFWDLL